MCWLAVVHDESILMHGVTNTRVVIGKIFFMSSQNRNPTMSTLTSQLPRERAGCGIAKIIKGKYYK